MFVVHFMYIKKLFRRWYFTGDERRQLFLVKNNNLRVYVLKILNRHKVQEGEILKKFINKDIFKDLIELSVDRDDSKRKGNSSLMQVE